MLEIIPGIEKWGYECVGIFTILKCQHFIMTSQRNCFGTKMAMFSKNPEIPDTNKSPKVYTIHYTIYTIHYTLYTIQYTIYMF